MTPENSAAEPVNQAGIVDLFGGIGCVAQGFARTGLFDLVALVDVDEGARDTYLHNFPEDTYLLEDVSTLSVERLMTAANGRTIVGVVGCPPCQGFSAAGRRRADDERNRLLASFFGVVEAVNPAFFVLENVPSVLYTPELAVLSRTCARRFSLCAGILNAACYGLPQTRQRAIVMGYHRDLEIAPTLPPPTHFGRRPVFHYGRQSVGVPSVKDLAGFLGESPHIGVKRKRQRGMADLLPSDPGVLSNLITVGEAIGDLACLSGTQTGSSRCRGPYAGRLGDGVSEPPNHERWGHTDELVTRLTGVPEGGRLETERRYFSQAYARLHRRGLARTVTTNFHNAGCGRFTHYAESRTLSVREAARLQGIADSFEFIGHRSLQERLVGNAFPTLWAEAIAEHVASQLAAVEIVRPMRC